MKRMAKVIGSAVMLLVFAAAAPADSPKPQYSTVPPAPEGAKPQYVTFEGGVKEIIEATTIVNGRILSIHVENAGGETIVYHLYDTTPVISRKTTDNVGAGEIKVGDKVSVSYGAMTPAALSYPPQISPEVVVIKDGGDETFFKVDKFDENYLSSDGELKLNVSDSTEIVDTAGKGLDKDCLPSSTLLVFYNVTTRSIPPQASPVKIIVVKNANPVSEGNAEEIEDFINGNAIPAMLKNGVKYVKIRAVAEAAGYEVEWNGETRTALLTKGASSFSFTLDAEMYGDARAVRYASVAPFIIDGYMYVDASAIGKMISE